MALVYFDPSALVKLLVEEAGTELAVQLWDGCDAAVASRLAYPEVRATLAAAHRARALSSHDLRSVERAWTQYWRSIRPIELTAEVEQSAGEVASEYSLRGADAVHLASALAVGDTDLVFSAWDRRLHAGAKSAGLRVAPARL